MAPRLSRKLFIKLGPRQRRLVVSVGAYILFGFAWILLSDALVHHLAANNIIEYALQRFKGMLFVILTAVFIIYALFSDARALDAANDNFLRHQQAAEAATRQLLKTQENERRDLHALFHDSIGQAIVGLKFEMEDALLHCEPKVREHIMQLVLKAGETVTNLSQNLRPAIVETIGLGPALFAAARKFGPATTTHIETDIQLQDAQFPNDVALNCFYIAEEALRNALLHAKASKIILSAHAQGNALELQIRDNGIGLRNEPNQSRTGLEIMRQRAILAGGELNIDSVPGKGTVVSAHFPIDDHKRTGIYG